MNMFHVAALACTLVAPFVACSADAPTDPSTGGAAGSGGTGAGGPTGTATNTGTVNIEGACADHDVLYDCVNAQAPCNWGSFLRAPNTESCDYEVIGEACFRFAAGYTATGLDSGDADPQPASFACHPALAGSYLYYRVTQLGVDVYGAPGVAAILEASTPEWTACGGEDEPALCGCTCE